MPGWRWCVRSSLLTSPGMEPLPREPGRGCLPSILSVPHSSESLCSMQQLGRRESPLPSYTHQRFSLSHRQLGTGNAEVLFLQRRKPSKGQNKYQKPKKPLLKRSHNLVGLVCRAIYTTREIAENNTVTSWQLAEFNSWMWSGQE